MQPHPCILWPLWWRCLLGLYRCRACFCHNSRLQVAGRRIRPMPLAATNLGLDAPAPAPTSLPAPPAPSEGIAGSWADIDAEDAADAEGDSEQDAADADVEPDSKLFQSIKQRVG